MASYAVGDIQGCLPQLKQLLALVEFSSKDKLWLAGDLVNRGPESLETLRFIKELGSQAISVLGNHDLHLLACWFKARKPNKKDTFDEILTAPDASNLMNWLLKQPLMHYEPKLGYAMTHAGIPPMWSIETASAYAREVEASLRSGAPELFFNNMYGNKPACWDEKLSGFTRLRVITNYFTRMRFCKTDGTLEFESKGDPADAPSGYLPWFEHEQHKCRKDKILFGHWAALLGETASNNFIGLDTGCVWGGSLSMMRLEDSQVFSVDCSIYAG